MRLRYIPGMRPTPMLAYYTEKDEKVFNEIAQDMNAEHISKYHHLGKHYWNMNAYVILEDDNKIKSAVFNEFIYVVYLLRIIGGAEKELILELPDDYFKLIENDLEQLIGEIEII